METPQVKSKIVGAIQDLPEDATVENTMERPYFLAKIERGLELVCVWRDNFTR